MMYCGGDMNAADSCPSDSACSKNPPSATSVVSLARSCSATAGEFVSPVADAISTPSQERQRLQLQQQHEWRQRHQQELQWEQQQQQYYHYQEQQLRAQQNLQQRRQQQYNFQQQQQIQPQQQQQYHCHQQQQPQPQQHQYHRHRQKQQQQLHNHQYQQGLSGIPPTTQRRPQRQQPDTMTPNIPSQQQQQQQRQDPSTALGISTLYINPVPSEDESILSLNTLNSALNESSNTGNTYDAARSNYYNNNDSNNGTLNKNKYHNSRGSSQRHGFDCRNDSVVVGIGSGIATNTTGRTRGLNNVAEQEPYQHSIPMVHIQGQRQQRGLGQVRNSGSGVGLDPTFVSNSGSGSLIGLEFLSQQKFFPPSPTYDDNHICVSNLNIQDKNHRNVSVSSQNYMLHRPNLQSMPDGYENFENPSCNHLKNQKLQNPSFDCSTTEATSTSNSSIDGQLSSSVPDTNIPASHHKDGDGNHRDVSILLPPGVQTMPSHYKNQKLRTNINLKSHAFETDAQSTPNVHTNLTSNIQNTASDSTRMQASTFDNDNNIYTAGSDRRQSVISSNKNSMSDSETTTDESFVKRLETGYRVTLHSGESSVGKTVLINMRSGSSSLIIQPCTDVEDTNNEHIDDNNSERDGMLATVTFPVRSVVRLEFGKTKCSVLSRPMYDHITPTTCFSIVAKLWGVKEHSFDFQAESVAEREALMSSLTIMLQKRKYKKKSSKNNQLNNVSISDSDDGGTRISSSNQPVKTYTGVQRDNNCNTTLKNRTHTDYSSNYQTNNNNCSKGSKYQGGISNCDTTRSDLSGKSTDHLMTISSIPSIVNYPNNDTLQADRHTVTRANPYLRSGVNDSYGTSSDNRSMISGGNNSTIVSSYSETYNIHNDTAYYGADENANNYNIDDNGTVASRINGKTRSKDTSYVGAPPPNNDSYSIRSFASSFDEKKTSKDDMFYLDVLPIHTDSFNNPQLINSDSGSGSIPTINRNEPNCNTQSIPSATNLEAPKDILKMGKYGYHVKETGELPSCKFDRYSHMQNIDKYSHMLEFKTENMDDQESQRKSGRKVSFSQSESDDAESYYNVRKGRASNNKYANDNSNREGIVYVNGNHNGSANIIGVSDISTNGQANMKNQMEERCPLIISAGI